MSCLILTTFFSPTSLLLGATEKKLYSLATFLLNERLGELDLERARTISSLPYDDDALFHNLLITLGVEHECVSPTKRKLDSPAMEGRIKRIKSDAQISEMVEFVLGSFRKESNTMPPLEPVSGVKECVFTIGERIAPVWPLQ